MNAQIVTIKERDLAEAQEVLAEAQEAVYTAEAALTQARAAYHSAKIQAAREAARPINRIKRLLGIA